MKPIRTKICGITRAEDAIIAADAGADAIGLNFYAGSKRFVDPQVAQQVANAVRGRVALVGVFVNSSLEEVSDIVNHVGLSHVQFHGDEQPSIVADMKTRLAGTFSIRAVRIREDDFESAQNEINQWQNAGVDAVLLDAAAVGAYGGTGERLNWRALSQLEFKIPWLLAGGLDPDNVASAITACEPGGVDVASGVELSPGIKSEMLICKFVSESKAN